MLQRGKDRTEGIDRGRKREVVISHANTRMPESVVGLFELAQLVRHAHQLSRRLRSSPQAVRKAALLQRRRCGARGAVLQLRRRLHQALRRLRRERHVPASRRTAGAPQAAGFAVGEAEVGAGHPHRLP